MDFPSCMSWSHPPGCLLLPLAWISPKAGIRTSWEGMKMEIDNVLLWVISSALVPGSPCKKKKKKTSLNNTMQYIFYHLKNYGVIKRPQNNITIRLWPPRRQFIFDCVHLHIHSLTYIMVTVYFHGFCNQNKMFFKSNSSCWSIIPTP